MKIVRLLTYDSGGAALCVQRLHNAIIKLGIDEKIIVANKDGNDESIIKASPDPYPWSKIWLLQKIQVLLCTLGIWPRFERYYRDIQKVKKLFHPNESIFLTSPVTNYVSLYNHPAIIEADIVNLHWISDFVDIPSFFERVRKPIIWSLHDENPGRGGLHYPNDDRRLLNIEKKFKKIKSESYKKATYLHIVVQSQAMKRFCQQNELLKSYPVSVINNGVDTKQFVMINKDVARHKLDLPLDRKIVLFMSVFLEDKRKGLDLLIRTLERMGNNEKITLICVGNYKEKPCANLDIRCLGFISDCSLLSFVYSASDLFVLPSFYESFAKTTLEAMACGTPVVAFPCSGTEDCIVDWNGIICEDFTENALFDGIQQVMNRKYNSVQIRNYIEENFTFEKMAMEYKNLYEKIIKEFDSTI